MVKWIETTGRTEEDAISAALFQLGLDRDDVSVEVVERAKSGFLGFGGNPAKVRVSYEVSEEGGKPQPMKDEFKISVFDEPAPVKKEEPKAAPAPAPAEAPPAAPSPPAHVLTDEERKRIMDDKKLNDFMGVFKGAQITSLK